MEGLRAWAAQLDFSRLIDMALLTCACLLCITFHEMCHGLTALALGDPTAKRAGRLTLNPRKHADPIGLVRLAVARVGWAKPVPINPRYFKNRRLGMAVTALAGPLSNLLLATAATVLYAVSQSVNGRVANTCNLSEDWVGYSTRYGDSVGDFSPLSRLTVTEVKAIGRELGLPADLVDKVPIDGLCGKTDEENLGFTYAALDKYIREGICEDAAVKERNLFKLELMPCFEP